MAHEKLICEFLDHRLARLRPASPVNVPKWVAMLVIAEGYELLALADICGKRHATLLVFHGARQGNWRHRVPFRQDQDALCQLQRGERAKEPKRIRPCHEDPGKVEHSAP